MLFSRSLAAPLLCTLILAACGPSGEPDVEQQVIELEKKNQQTAVKQSGTAAPTTPALLDAAGLAAKDERVEIILLLPDTRVALQEFQRNGLATLVGRQAGYKLTTHDAAGDPAKQIEQFRLAIAAKPVAIIVAPIDPPALAALIVEASTAGIPVIGLDKRMLNEGCASIVFSEQRLVGRLAGQTVVEALKRKAAEEGAVDVTGRVLQLRGAEDDHTSDEIAAGFSEALQSAPGVIIVHDSPAEWNAEKATQRTTEAFRLQKNFDVIYAHNDAIAVGAAKAAETAGQRENMLIVGTDGLAGQKRGIELVRGGELDATIVQPALVDLALQIILKMRSDNTFKPKPSYEVQPVAILPKNADESFRTGTYKLPAL
jgi:ABC-type sugar transport system substrate-binding protein